MDYLSKAQNTCVNEISFYGNAKKVHFDGLHKQNHVTVGKKLFLQIKHQKKMSKKGNFDGLCKQVM
jgi:hypothetical protein